MPAGVSAMSAPPLIVAFMTITLNGPSQLTELPTDMLERFRARAGELDRTNTYFHEDLDELRAAGYLAAAVPSHLGGWGFDLAQMATSQRRLARYCRRPRWP